MGGAEEVVCRRAVVSDEAKDALDATVSHDVLAAAAPLTRKVHDQLGKHPRVHFPCAAGPLSFAISLILDGRGASVVGACNSTDAEAGNGLALRLKPVSIPPEGKHTQNHWARASGPSACRRRSSRGARSGRCAPSCPRASGSLRPSLTDIFSLEY